MKKFISTHKISHFPGFLGGVHFARENMPEGLTVHHTITSKENDCAICLIEAKSLEDVQHFVHEFVGEHSENTFFEVCEDTSLGLPDK